ncbi:Uncharacterised protein [Burkholderia pseudomallei]|nr:Uncharacterised protein [Burkholderia pseudomallei]VBF96551.1 Uncharacterised protein [Burkholderia pseudomallei]
MSTNLLKQKLGQQSKQLPSQQPVKEMQLRQMSESFKFSQMVLSHHRTTLLKSK